MCVSKDTFNKKKLVNDQKRKRYTGIQIQKKVLSYSIQYNHDVI